MIPAEPVDAAARSLRARMRRIARLTPAARQRWLRGLPREAVPDMVRRMADLVTSTTRVDLADAEALGRTLAWVAAQVDDDVAAARAWRAAGHVSALSLRYRVALGLYQRALRRFERVGQPVEAAVTRSGALQTLIYLGRYRTAFQWAARARRVFADHGDTLRLARLDTNLANILHRHDRFDEALARYRSALDAFVAGGHARDEAIVLRNMAVCYIGLNQLGPAMDAYRRGRECALRLGLTGVVAAVDYNIAYLHYLRGDYDRAIELYDVARRRCEAAHDRYHAALCDLDHAELALELNLVDEGASLATSAYERFRALGLAYERAKALVNRGVAAQRVGDWSIARRNYRDARRLFAREGNAAWTALLDVYTAFVMVEQGQAHRADALGRSALARFAKMPFADRTALAHYVLARGNMAQGRITRAMHHCDRALVKLEMHPVPALAYRVWHLLGQARMKIGHEPQAVQAFELAHDHVESLRGRLGTDSLKIAFLVDKLAVYESLVGAALRSNGPKLERVFQLMEQAKGRTLVEQLTTRAHRPIDIERRETTSRLAALYRTREAQSRTLNANGRQERAARLEREIRRLERRSMSGGAGPDASRHDDILERVQRALPKGGYLIEYYVVDGQLLGWVVGRETAVVQELGPLRRVERELRFLRFQLARCRWRSEHSPPAPDAAVEHLRELHVAMPCPSARCTTVRHSSAIG